MKDQRASLGDICRLIAAAFTSAAFAPSLASATEAGPAPPTPVAVVSQGEAANFKQSRNYFNLRVGANSGNENNRPEICMEAAPFRKFSFEACGTGNDVFHNNPAPAISHYRTKARLNERKVGSFFLQTYALVGFAELQVGVDRMGFQFSGTGEDRVETAGPEAGISLRGLLPSGWGDTELIGELTLSGAWMAHAPELAVSYSRFQPSVGFTLGFGF